MTFRNYSPLKMNVLYTTSISRTVFILMLVCLSLVPMEIKCKLIFVTTEPEHCINK
jgi:hypothetical protein